jgi:hypothetical protein
LSNAENQLATVIALCTALDNQAANEREIGARNQIRQLTHRLENYRLDAVQTLTKLRHRNSTASVEPLCDHLAELAAPMLADYADAVRRVT